MIRKPFLTPLILIFPLFIAQGALANRVSNFIILNDQENMATFTKRLETLGANVRMRMPPHILTLEAEDSFDPSTAGSIKKTYRGLIPLDEMNSYGPLATAAAVQWNRRIVQGTSTPGFHSAGTMRTLAAHLSLPPPNNVTLTVNRAQVHIAWEELPGPTLYEVEISKTAEFTEKIESITMANHTILPRPITSEKSNLYARVRGRDGDLRGEWSSPISVVLDPFSPAMIDQEITPTSPLDGAVSDGLAVALEWIAQPNYSYRVQISDSKSFDTSFIDVVITGGECVPPSAAMQIGKTYFWRIQQWDRFVSPWSTPRAFIIGEPEHPQDAMINPEAPR